MEGDLDGSCYLDRCFASSFFGLRGSWSHLSYHFPISSGPPRSLNSMFTPHFHPYSPTFTYFLPSRCRSPVRHVFCIAFSNAFLSKICCRVQQCYLRLAMQPGACSLSPPGRRRHRGRSQQLVLLTMYLPFLIYHCEVKISACIISGNGNIEEESDTDVFQGD